MTWNKILFRMKQTTVLGYYDESCYFSRWHAQTSLPFARMLRVRLVDVDVPLTKIVLRLDQLQVGRPSIFYQ